VTVDGATSRRVIVDAPKGAVLCRQILTQCPRVLPSHLCLPMAPRACKTSNASSTPSGC
jgi:hypothetical protein